MCVVFTDKDGQPLTEAALLDDVRQKYPCVLTADQLGVCRIPAQVACWKVMRDSYGPRESINGFNGYPQSTNAIYVDENGLFLFGDDGVFVDATGNADYKIMGELTLPMVRKLALHVDAVTQRAFNARVKACASLPTA